MICQICKSKVYKVHKVIKKVKIYECKNCELGFTNNMTNMMRSNQSGNALYNFKGYKKEEKKLRRGFERLIKVIKKYKKSGDVLDVGAGFGLFSSILSRFGKYKIDILEPNLKPYYLRSITHTFYKFNFENFIELTKLRDRGNLPIKWKKKRYDLIIFMDVVEHLENPLESLLKIKPLLAKGGILVIQTPNYKSLMAKICQDWAWWMVEDHKFFFSPKSIKLILKKAGFKIKYIITYEDWQDFKKNLDGNFIDIKSTFVRKIVKGVFLLLFLPIYFLTRKLLWNYKYGGLMFIIAK